MLKTCILSLFQDRYNKNIIYIHNLSFFDGIFLLKVFSSINNMVVIPLIKDSKMFNIELIYNGIKISFRYSFLMLPR